MAQTSFDIDDKTSEILEGLKKVYGVNSNAGVLRRALAIALIAARHADEDHNIRLLSTKAGKEREVIVPQRP
jgi:hypothetical protein